MRHVLTARRARLLAVQHCIEPVLVQRHAAADAAAVEEVSAEGEEVDTEGDAVRGVWSQSRDVVC